jgi:large subunit ribosomal protein L25
MELHQLKAKKRDAVGKGEASKERRAGLVPGTMYGEGQEAVSLTLDAREFTRLVHGRGGEHAIVQLDIENAPDLSSPAMVKAVQHHPLRDNIVHADFMRIRLDQRITTAVSVTLVGESVGVIEGGVLDHQLREVEIECLALDVPETIEVDVSALTIGDSLHVSDLAVPENVTLLTESNRAVAAIMAPRVVEEEAAAEEVEGEEGEEVEGEGAADAEGGAE